MSYEYIERKREEMNEAGRLQWEHGGGKGSPHKHRGPLGDKLDKMEQIMNTIIERTPQVYPGKKKDIEKLWSRFDHLKRQIEAKGELHSRIGFNSNTR